MGALEAVWEHWRLCGVATWRGLSRRLQAAPTCVCQLQRRPRARQFRAWSFPLGACSNLQLRFPSFIPLSLSLISCPGSGHTHVHL